MIARQKLHRAPIRVLKFLYPIPYLDAVKFRSGDAIDPFFVYSVMRQESIFNFEISSPVGARGLLQIMPATGKQLAKLEEIPDFDPNMLYNPYLNIRLGTRYLIDLKKEYDNDYMYVLGNYNAGPKPTKRWQAAGGNLPWDIRAEEISYWETRDYVKRVMGNYWIYQEIWNQLPNLFVFLLTLIPAICFACGNILAKSGLSAVAHTVSIKQPWAFIKLILRNKYWWMGFSLSAIANLGYYLAMALYDISLVQPMMTLNPVLTALLVSGLKEHLTKRISCDWVCFWIITFSVSCRGKFQSSKYYWLVCRFLCFDFHFSS